MSRRHREYTTWRNRCWMLAPVLLALALGPLIYCMGWGVPPEGVDATTVGYCVRTHPLQFPTTIFVFGAVTALAGFVFHNLRGLSGGDGGGPLRSDDGRGSMRTPRLSDGLEAAGRDVPDEIDVGGDVDFSDGAADDERADSDSMMAYVEREQQLRDEVDESSRSADGDRRARDYYVPPGMEDAVELFVDGDIDTDINVDLDERADNPQRPYGDVDRALADAFQLVMERHTAVVVRVMPGVYQTSLEIPGRVAVVNHHMPVDATVDERLDWIREQQEVDDAERVTFLPPRDADVAVRMVPGEKQGIFGCFFAGRQGVAQVGLQCRDNAAVVVVNCGFESFRGGGTEVVDSGEEYAGRRIQFIGSVWRSNSAPDRGGALRIQSSVVRVEASIFENNRAPSGGAVSIATTDKPVVFERSLMQRNRALGGDSDPSAPGLALERWAEVEGVGGAMRVQDGLVKVVDTIFDGNDAAVGGGAVGAVGARIVVESTGEGRGVFRENRAAVGGAGVAVGDVDTPAMIRLKSAEVRKNLGTASGGGVVAVGRALVDARDAHFESNRTNDGDGAGIAAWCGGAVRLRGGDYLANKAAGNGGAVAVNNGSLELVGRPAMRDNAARGGSGGAIYAVTSPNRRLETRAGMSGFSLPFEVRIEQCRIESNDAAGPGGGVRAGNCGNTATFPLIVNVERSDWIDANHAGDDRPHCHNIWIQWAGQMKVSDATVGSVELLLE